VRFDQTLTVPVTPGSFVVVRASGDGALLDLLARGDALPLAFTNPIWLAALRPQRRPERPSPRRTSTVTAATKSCARAMSSRASSSVKLAAAS
jgi:hypothetical protein